MTPGLARAAWTAPRPPAAVSITAAVVRHRSGGTATADGRTLTTPDDYPARYVVGGVVPSITLPADADPDVIRDAVDLLTPDVVGRGHGIGWWTEGSTLWIDVVTFHADRADAVRTGADRGEIAVFDSHAAAVVYVPAGVTR